MIHAPRMPAVVQGPYENSERDDWKSLYTDTTAAVVEAVDRRSRRENMMNSCSINVVINGSTMF